MEASVCRAPKSRQNAIGATIRGGFWQQATCPAEVGHQFRVAVKNHSPILSLG